MTYKQMLEDRARKVEQAQPVEPDAPMSMTQYQNKLATKRWRERYREATRG